jgi:hypothetical protein
MAHTVTAATSPLNCRWIEPGSRRSIEQFEYAVCRRIRGAERVVNEAECMYCPAWEAHFVGQGTNREKPS